MPMCPYMQFSSWIGISWRLTIITTILIFSSFIFLGSTVFFSSKEKIEEHLSHESEYILEIAAASLREPLWVFDYKTIDSITRALIDQDQSTFLAIRILDSHNKVLIQHFNPLMNITEFQKISKDPNYHFREKKITYDGDNIALMQAVFSAKQQKADLLQFTIYLTVMTLFLAFVVTLILYGLTRRMLLSPLKKLTQIAAQMERGNYRMPDDVWEHEFHILAKGLQSAVDAIKRRDHELKMHAENLESLVELRTRELDQERMRSFHNSQLAALGEMSAGIAHEINNPLSIISGNAQMLRRSVGGDAKSMERIEKISAMVRRIANIVRGLRTFARDGSKDPMNHFPISPFVEELKDLCHSRMKSQDIEFKVDCPEGLRAFGREVQISQVLLNLINNSIDAIEKNSEKWIRLDVMDKESEIIFAVTDSGSGIPEALRDKIMQPFFTTKDVGKGTGLGLSISIGIVQDHGGNLVYNAKCPNTRFEVRLPKKAASVSEAA